MLLGVEVVLLILLVSRCDGGSDAELDWGGSGSGDDRAALKSKTTKKRKKRKMKEVRGPQCNKTRKFHRQSKLPGWSGGTTVSPEHTSHEPYDNSARNAVILVLACWRTLLLVARHYIQPGPLSVRTKTAHVPHRR